ncbi:MULTISPECIES: hypothetical protein [unclassified Streptomyces]|uniref:hypothetical protein n=1 Tax=unclassified Streptomyces TaxID=2593676 RepID=UPI0037FF6CB5
MNPGQQESAPPIQPASAPHPSQLPSITADFTGRAWETEAVATALANVGRARWGVPVVTIGGMGGAGKATLAVAAGHRVSSSFPDGQLNVDLRGGGEEPARPTKALAAVLAPLGQSGELPL